nr:hypothetical protein [Candidatus Njordarchaeota archaeon]
MLLEDLFNQFFMVLIAFLLIISIVIVIGLLFQSTRSAMFSFLRWMLHGFWSLSPYAISVFVGLAVGALSYDLLSFSSATMRLGLGVALFLASTYSLLALPFHRIKWWSPPVKFALVLCSLVILLDLGIGSFIADDAVRGAVTWVLSVLTSWLLLYERDTLSAFTSFLSHQRNRKHSSSSPKGSSLNSKSSRASRLVSIAREDDGSFRNDQWVDGDEEEVVGSVEVVGVPESYFSGKVVSQGYSDGSGVGGDDVASRFRAFVMSLVQGGSVFGFKQIFNEGRGRFFIQCREDGVSQLRRVLQDIDAALHSWFPDFETEIHCGDFVDSGHGGCHACGWVANLPAPSRNPMKHVAELFVQRKLTGSVTIIVESSSSRLSSFSRKLQYRRLSAKARKQGAAISVVECG